MIKFEDHTFDSMIILSVMRSCLTNFATLVAPLFITGCGRTGPDPLSDITLEDGTIVPVGKGADTGLKNSSLLYNEYPSQRVFGG